MRIEGIGQFQIVDCKSRDPLSAKVDFFGIGRLTSYIGAPIIALEILHLWRASNVKLTPKRNDPSR